jgi:hypothetical protein
VKLGMTAPGVEADVGGGFERSVPAEPEKIAELAMGLLRWLGKAEWPEVLVRAIVIAAGAAVLSLVESMDPPNGAQAVVLVKASVLTGGEQRRVLVLLRCRGSAEILEEQMTGLLALRNLVDEVVIRPAEVEPGQDAATEVCLLSRQVQHDPSERDRSPGDDGGRGQREPGPGPGC